VLLMSCVRVTTEPAFVVITGVVGAGQPIEQSFPSPNSRISSTVPRIVVEWTREQRLCMSLRAIVVLFAGSGR
jgi:hypothetical protein